MTSFLILLSKIVPQSGILSHIAYKYRNEKFGNRITVNRTDGNCRFTIPMTHLRKNELIIYIGTKPALGFKCQRQ